MSRVQQDTFIDDTEEFCPLCVEELDIQDKNFKPCPCGYQICQFCFNNIRTNLNGLCPACRRAYNEKTIEYKPIPTEQVRAEKAKKDRQQSEKRKYEAQKREAEALNRERLRGLRVVQKNLVYVTGLNPRIREEDLLQTLRGVQYFGQYGKIIKIVVNKRTTAQDGQGGSGAQGPQGLGVYVTFARKEDAHTCITAVDGSQNGDSTLRATYGTTKYCSAYLRGEACPNKNCMFLHEPGEEAESFDRQGLSEYNTRMHTASTRGPPPQQQPQVAAGAPSQQAHPQPPQHNAQMTRISSHQGRAGTPDGGESSALPSTANWAKNLLTPAVRSAVPVSQQVISTTVSKVSTPSPKTAPAPPMVQSRSQESGKSGSSGGKGPASTATTSSIPSINGKSSSIAAAPASSESTSSSSDAPPITKIVPPPGPPKPIEPEPSVMDEHLQRFFRCQRAAANPKFKFIFSTNFLSPDEYQDIENIPPMFDRHGGKRRREIAEKIRNQQDHGHEEPPEEVSQPQPPVGTMAGTPGLHMNVAGRGATPLQRDPLALLKETVANQQQQQGLGAFQQQENIQQQLQQQQQQQNSMRIHTPGGLLHQQQQQAFNPFQAGAGSLGGPGQQSHSGSMHARQSSRYTFANENPASAVTSVNPRGNAVHMAEQVRMMPQQAQQQLHNQQLAAQFYGATGGAPGLGGGMLGGNVQQPPPGLKSAPTPPAPGMGMPMGGIHSLGGQFSGLGLGGHHGKSENSEVLLREFMRGNGAAGLVNAGSGLGRAGDGKLDLVDPSILQARVAQPQQQQHQIHHQGLQTGNAQGQQGAYNQSMYYGNVGRWLLFGGLSFHKGYYFNTTCLGLNLGTGFFPPNQSQTPSRNLTPGVIDEEDFPALAPPKPAAITKPIVLIAVPTIAITAKKSVAMNKQPTSIALGNSTPESIWKAKRDEETTMSQTPATVTPTSLSKKRPELPRVDTASPAMAEAAKGESTPTPVTAPRMIKILPMQAQAGLKSANSESALSETASVSGMSSRPVSPPPQQQQPQKKSKSALKRERREKERKEAEEKECELQRENEREKERLRKTDEVHAPVVGRMKKKDKKHADGSIESPSSPYQAEEKEETLQIPTTEERDVPTSSATTTATAISVEAIAQTASERATTSNKTVAQLLQEINDIHFATLEMFKSIVGIRYELHNTGDELAQIKVHDTTTTTKSREPGQQLQHPGTTEINLRGGGTITMRQLITPGGNVLTGLTQQQEERFLKLEESRKHERAWERYPTTMKEWKWTPKDVMPMGEKEDGKAKVRVTLEELKEQVMVAKKETEAFEKKLEKLLKRNKKLVGLA